MKWVGDDEFFAAMDANPDAVYAVNLFHDGERKQTGLFSTKAKTNTWCNHPDFDDMTAVVVPYVIDEPDFRNKVAS